ncbi:MAG: DUF2628 domain-containing protein [Methyloligellaceae bacterium]
MKYYTVHQPPVPQQDRLDQADELIFVKDGFAWLAFYLPPVWMLINRLWLEFVVYIIAIIGWVQFSASLGMEEPFTTLSAIVISLALGFEGNNLIRWKLNRQDYRQLGTVSGVSQDECELKFFTYWSPKSNDMSALDDLIPGTPGNTAKMSDYGFHIDPNKI